MSVKFYIEFAGTEFPVASFNYRSDEGGNSGSCVVEGIDYVDFINNNAESGTLTLTKNSTEILTCSIDPDTGVSIGPTESSISIKFEDDIVFSGSTPATFDVDDLTGLEQMNNGLWSFRLNEVQQGYQNGMTVNYLEVERYIETVTVSWSGISGTVTLTEGELPPDDEEVPGDPGMQDCTYELFLGTPSSTAFSIVCSSGYEDPDSTYVSPEGYNYEMFVFIVRQFTLPADDSITLEFQTGRPGLDTSTGTASGFEFDLIQGEYIPFTNPAPTVYTYRGDGEFVGELLAGIYTCRLTLYINRDVDPASWVTTPYYIYARLT